MTERKNSHERGRGGGGEKKGKGIFLIYSTKYLEEYDRPGDTTSSRIIEESDTNISTNQGELIPTVAKQSMLIVCSICCNVRLNRV